MFGDRYTRPNELGPLTRKLQQDYDDWVRTSKEHFPASRKFVIRLGWKAYEQLLKESESQSLDVYCGFPVRLDASDPFLALIAFT